ncbi:DUF2520 domain-containing protein [Phytoactinopolyspora mesophila]|uniref:DUF2520 domain-containing protein n=1 Tax=Phytoactinopolyspora mesophila TaxID=2650750 RepID=A0A7K3M4Y5_9ACTN|nr:DUF2520 domain-containing protein [Phytoactinopolyspora mesophila]
MEETDEQRPARLDVGVVGTGRVGAVLGAALARSGHRVVAGYGVSVTSRSRADALLPGLEMLEVAEVFERADLVLLTVPDDVLPGLVDGLANTGAIRSGQFVVHTSGRFGVSVLDPATRAGGLPLALHPAMTFTGTSVDLQRLEGATFGVTAPELLWPVAEALVIEMGSEPVRVAEDQRALYHAALTHGANHLVTLVNDAMDMLRAAGVALPERSLAPLLSAALDNTLRQGDDALTGPVSRGDSGTVAGHLQEIDRAMPEATAVYTALARRTAGRALASGRLQATDAEPLLEILASDPPE